MSSSFFLVFRMLTVAPGLASKHLVSQIKLVCAPSNSFEKSLKVLDSARASSCKQIQSFKLEDQEQKHI